MYDTTDMFLVRQMLNPCPSPLWIIFINQRCKFLLSKNSKLLKYISHSCLFMLISTFDRTIQFVLTFIYSNSVDVPPKWVYTLNVGRLVDLSNTKMCVVIWEHVFIFQEKALIIQRCTLRARSLFSKRIGFSMSSWLVFITNIMFPGLYLPFTPRTNYTFLVFLGCWSGA